MTTAAAPARTPASDVGVLPHALADALGLAIRGKPAEIRTALVAILSGGHLLIEDVPGVGKTLLAKAIAHAIGGAFRRIQGTPDLLPTDITGVRVLDRASNAWRFHPGPIFGNVVVFDEINRATPRTQAALLEAMEEGQVTAEGTTHRLPSPFIVVATQNPMDHAGTFPLVEGQLDRFAALLTLGLPDRTAERDILTAGAGTSMLARVRPVASPEDLAATVASIRSLHCSPPVVEYVLDLAHALRTAPQISRGPSPRASLALLHSARAAAALAGRSYVTPDDVKAVAPAALAHRIRLHVDDSMTTARRAVDAILGQVPAPRP